MSLPLFGKTLSELSQVVQEQSLPVFAKFYGEADRGLINLTGYLE